MGTEKKGFIEKIKEFFKRLKEENAGFGAAMKRINSSGFCGNINRGVKKENCDFWNGSYISVEGDKAVIYGSNQPDYVFGADDIASFDVVVNAKCTVSKGNQTLPGVRFNISFKDGKKAQADILVDKVDALKKVLAI